MPRSCGLPLMPGEKVASFRLGVKPGLQRNTGGGCTSKGPPEQGQQCKTEQNFQGRALGVGFRMHADACAGESDLDNGRVLEASEAAGIPASCLCCSLDLCRAGACLCHRPLVQDPYADRWVRHTCLPCDLSKSDNEDGKLTSLCLVLLLTRLCTQWACNAAGWVTQGSTLD